MSKYYAYHYPDPQYGDIQVIQSVKEILKEGTILAETIYSGYSSAQQAIDEYIVVHWAYPCTKTGQPIWRL